jgi:ribose-phosphate pyrophosphokinase
VLGRNALIVDDEIDTAGSMMQAARVVKENGARNVYAAATHGVLSGKAVERLGQGEIDEVVLSDTLPLPPSKRLPCITVLSVAELLAGAILRIHEGRSVAELFHMGTAAR